MINVKLLLTAFFWGGTFIAGRVVAGTIEPYSAAFLRFFVALLFLVFFAWRIEGRLPLIKKNQIFPILLLGASGIFIYNVFFFKGLRLIEAGRAAIIIANNPIVIFLLSVLFFKEKLTPVTAVGVLLSVFGALLVITKGSPFEALNANIGRGELFIFICVLSWAAFSLIGKTILKGLSPLAAITYATLAGMVLLFIPACMNGFLQNIRHYPLKAWLAVFYLGFFGTVLGFVWYYEGIRTIGPTKASLFINFVPISAVALAFIVLGEPLTTSLLTGTIFVSLGVFLTHWDPRGNGRVLRHPKI
ncbi:MAG: DMT family transporter [Desulfobacterales bacterium]|nr:DMT family transporter [Desulfobacterales bacterium]